MIAILSDIHSNLHALEAVLEDMPKVSAIYILGDTIGGASPFPCEVLDRLMGLSVPVSSVLGNWEWMMVTRRHDITQEIRNSGTKLAAGAWAMDALEEHHWNYLESLDMTIKANNMLLSHGRPDDVLGVVLSQEDADELVKSYSEKWLICGHTHRTRLFKVGSQRIVNAGSVGLSADCISGAACYALLDEAHISFRHVPYDVEAAVRAIEISEIYALAKDYADRIIEIMRTGRF